VWGVSLTAEHAPDGDKAAYPPDALNWIIQVWSTILEQAISADDDFFAMGGDSLLALQVTAFFQDEGYPDLPPSAVLRWKTPAEFSAALNRYRASACRAKDDIQP
jgi:acyl carrier protein